MFQGAGLILAAGTVAMAALAVPPATYGQYGLMLSVVQIASGVGLGWINQGLLRVGREEFRQRGSSSDSLAGAVALSAGMMVILSAAAFSLGPALEAATGFSATTFAFLAISLLAFGAYETLSYAAQANGRLDGYAGGQIIARAGPFVAVVLMLAGWATSATFLMVCASLGWAAAAIYTGGATFARGFQPTAEWEDKIRAIVRYGRWLPIGSAAGMLSQWMGLWFVRSHVGLAEAGVLLWAMGVYSMVAGALQPLGAILSPRMVDLRLADDKVEIQYRLDLILAAGLLAAALMPAALGLIKLVGATVLPSSYAGAVPLLTLLLAAFPSILLAAGLSPLVVAFEALMPRLVAMNVAAAAFNFAGLTILVTRFGAVGAAISSTLAVFVMTTGMLAFARSAAGDAGRRRRSYSRQSVIGLLPSAVAVAMLPLSGSSAVAFGCALTAAGLAAGRAMGAFFPLSALRPQVAALPRPISALALRVLSWISIDAPQRPSAPA